MGKKLSVIVAILCLLNLYILFTHCLYLMKYVFIEHIEIQRIDDTPYQIRIPIKHIDRKLLFHIRKTCLMYTKDKKRYTLKKDSSNILWITISRLELAGFTVFSARYKITDPEIEKELSDYYDKNAVE